MFLYPNDYELGIMEMNPNAVFEIDSVEELKKIDKQMRCTK